MLDGRNHNIRHIKVTCGSAPISQTAKCVVYEVYSHFNSRPVCIRINITKYAPKIQTHFIFIDNAVCILKHIFDFIDDKK